MPKNFGTRRDQRAPKQAPSMYPERVNELRQSMYWILEEPDASSDVPRFLTMGVAALNVLMILVSLASLVIETEPFFKETTEEIVWKSIEIISTACFTVEYLLRFWVCDVYGASAVDWFFKPMNICDLLAILPVYVELMSAANFKMLRVLRVVRLFKIGRYSSGVRMMNTAISNSLSALYILNFLFLICSVIFASIIYFSEKLSCPDAFPSISDFQAYNTECSYMTISETYGTCCAYMCGNMPGGMGAFPLCKSEWREETAIKLGRRLATDWQVEPMHELDISSVLEGMWWAAVTMTTVGYGDIVPKHWVSKLVASVAMLTGMLIIAMPFAIVGTKFSEAAQDCAEEQGEVSEDEEGDGESKSSSSPAFGSVIPATPKSPKMAPMPTVTSKSSGSATLQEQLQKLRSEVGTSLELKKEIMQLQQLRDNLWTSVEHSMVVLAFEGSISFSADMIDGPWIKIPASPKKSKPVAEFPYCDYALRYIHRDWLIRRLAVTITTNWIFESLVLLLIVANSVILAMQNYYYDQENALGNVLQRESENVFTILFTLECAMKIVACGFIAHPKAYIRDPWNWIDFIVVVAGLLTALQVSAFSFLRSVRVLRPLRSLAAVPGIRNLFRTIILSLPGLKDVVLLAMFLLVMFGVLGLHFWSGMLHRSCRLTEQPLHFSQLATQANCTGWCFDNSSIVNVTLSASTWKMVNSAPVFDAFCRPNADCLKSYMSGTDYHLWPMDSNQERFCGEYKCRALPVSDLNDGELQVLDSLGSVKGTQVSTVCGSPLASDPEYSPQKANPDFAGLDLENWDKEVDGEGRNFGLTNFDNVGASFLVVFQSVTLEGWSDVMQMVQDAQSTAFGFIYFMLLILIGSFFLINVILAIIWDAFCGVEYDKKKEEAEKDEASDEKDDSGSKQHNDEDLQQRSLTCKDRLRILTLERGSLDPEKNPLPDSDYAIVQWARRVATHYIFNGVIMFLIGLNVLLLSLDTYPRHLISPEVGEVLNYIFNATFLLESVILHFAYGPTIYWSDNAMAFDGVIVLISIADIASDFASGSENSGSAFTALRAFRMLRILKLFKKFPSIKILMGAGVKTLMSMGDFVALLVLIICVFALVAQSFFGGTFMFDPDENVLVLPEDYRKKCPMGDGDKPVCVPRAHFDTFVWSFVTIFQILTGENWNTVMYDGMRAAGWPALFYFLFVVLFGNFVILNLFLAILMSNFDEQRALLAQKHAEEARALKAAKQQAVSALIGSKGASQAESEDESQDGGECQVMPVTPADGNKAPSSAEEPEGKKKMAWGEDTGRQQEAASGKAGDELLSVIPGGSPPSDGKAKTEAKQQASDSEDALPFKFNFGTDKCEERAGPKSCFIFHEEGIVRSACLKLIENPRFDQTIVVLIAISSLLMAFENPLRDPEGLFVKAMQVASAVFTLIFFFELIVKMIGLGALCSYDKNRKAYLRSFENVMDFVIVLVSVIDTIQTWFLKGLGGGVVSVMKIFRVVRMLRPLRLISRNKNLRVVIKTVMASLPELRNLLVFSAMFFLIFGLIFVSIYKGSFYSCKDSGLEDFSLPYPSLDITPLCIPEEATVSNNSVTGSLRVVQMRGNATTCAPGFQSWQRPSTSTPMCEVHCEGEAASKHSFCKDRDIWGYHIMRCTDCSAAFCTKDSGTKTACRNQCLSDEYFCKGKDEPALTQCLEQCIASCECRDSCMGIVEDAALCVEQGGKWVNMNQNFDNILVGMVSLFEICTTEGWVDVMLAAVDVRGPYLSPRRDENEITGTGLFIAFMLIGSFFVLNLCVGVIIDNYNKQKEDTGSVMVTETQAEWMAFQKALFVKKDFFTQVNVDRLGPSRQHRFRIISSAAFENFIMSCIVLNTITLMMVWQPRPTGSLQTALSTCNFIFAVVFHFECIIKLSALHWNYFREWWNVFDFFCVFISDVVAIVESAMAGDSSVNLASLVSALRIFRVARLFRLVRFLKGLNKLILAFALSVPKLLNVGIVMLLLIYLYAVLGMSLFAKVAYTGTGIIGETTNFRTFFKACVLLIRSMTGEGFNEIMHDLSKGPFFYKSILDLKCEVPMDITGVPFHTLDQDGDGLIDNPTECGTALSYVYFISYTLIVSFVILNLFIAVIFEGFEESSGSETKEVINKCLENWERYDPYNTMHVPLTKALDFIDETLEELVSQDGPRKVSQIPESRWDPNSTMDMNASDEMWSMYNLHYVRTLGLQVRSDGKVRLVQAVKAVIRRLLISGSLLGEILPKPERRRRATELEYLEMLIENAEEDKEDLVELKFLEARQKKHINSVLGKDISIKDRMRSASVGVAGVASAASDDKQAEGDGVLEFSFLEKVAAAKIQRRAKESLQRRRDRANPNGANNANGPIMRAAA
eukprot:TRINITY_DN14902_c0_g1_i1.p1 TRINITY_DN14902_c0_g1~~TRINITY_DN14902_c0_g1_i1.p1  ORF type:complete len:2368 (-),score=487.75 TRINITY_DN14902_c0_g1_i1:53-7156(-)